MQNTLQGLKRSVSIKTAVIGFLVLVLLIPVSMIKGIVHDRESVHQQARYGIMQSWGNQQLIAGPILVVPFTLTHVNSKGIEIIEENWMYLLPETLSFTTNISPEVRYRGLHKVPIYTADIVISGRFNKAKLDVLGIRSAKIDWQKALVVLSVADARAITETPSITIGDKSVRFEPGGRGLFADMPPPITAAAGTLLQGSPVNHAIDFSMTLRVNGSDSLQFVPLGDTTHVSMSSDWPSPSFLGNYLPSSRSVSDAGFTAKWKIASLGRALPSQWTDRQDRVPNAYQSTFGVTFYMPVSLYQLTLRATKYAVLFIGLSFVAYFLFEIMANLRLHPLQYLLVGFANATFYLLLLSLAEHMGFGWAYLVSATASAGLITAYSAVILAGRQRGYIMAVVLTGLYAFLYMTLKAENFALVAGAVGLWLTLAAVMYMTRRIDWYSAAEAPVQE